MTGNSHAESVSVESAFGPKEKETEQELEETVAVVLEETPDGADWAEKAGSGTED